MKSEFLLWWGIFSLFAFIGIMDLAPEPITWGKFCLALGIGLVFGSALTWWRWGNGRRPAQDID